MQSETFKNLSSFQCEPDLAFLLVLVLLLVLDIHSLGFEDENEEDSARSSINHFVQRIFGDPFRAGFLESRNQFADNVFVNDRLDRHPAELAEV